MTGKLWLRDFLPASLPNSRIMTFGYNSAYAFSDSVAIINDFAHDLLNMLNGKRLNVSSHKFKILVV